MLRNILEKIVGTTTERTLKKAQPVVARINRLEEEYQKLSEEELKAKTAELRERVAGGESLDEVLPEAFAVVKNACRRLCGQSWEVRGQLMTWNIVPFDTQLIGGMVLHSGAIAEMKTGEGKTLVSSLPAYLNALTGKGVHMVTVNNYLASRDAEWMGGLFRYLGLTVGVIDHGIPHEARKAAYACDITYGTNTEFGFDYLRDNMTRSLRDTVQRELHYAVVDEVDSILIDEARTPLIISAPAEEGTDKYGFYAHFTTQLVAGTDYTLDEKMKTAVLTEAGIQKAEQLLGVENIYTERGYAEVHHIEQALKAFAVYRKDKDYVVTDEGEIMIVDEFTGRLMPGRRFSDGLHQALEAKEGVEVKRESKTLATITLQNYFRMYAKLSGMTGTAETEAEEFAKIYGLETVVVPTHRKIARVDMADSVYKTEAGKYAAVVKRIQEVHAGGQPILVGTTTIEKSERVSHLLTQCGIAHTVLNAKQHQKEAEIIARAGEKGAVTIATNMAGRGTDIKLGEGAGEAGGLYVIGTERHESRRIDNQLRGRSGRQGDPGKSQFFVSMEDSLMRLFGGKALQNIMDFLKVPEDMPIENGSISGSIESAQKKVEAHHFDQRKHLVQYDDILNTHREIVYRRRRKLLEKEQVEQEVMDTLSAYAEHIVQTALTGEEWDMELLVRESGAEKTQLERMETREEVLRVVEESLVGGYRSMRGRLPEETVRVTEKNILLSVLDRMWMDHLENMRNLREQVALMGYGQRDPLQEYKKESFALFEALMQLVVAESARELLRIRDMAGVASVTVQPVAAVTNEAEVEAAVEAPAQETEIWKLLKPNKEVQNLGKSGKVVIRADEGETSGIVKIRRYK